MVEQKQRELRDSSLGQCKSGIQILRSPVYLSQLSQKLVLQTHRHWGAFCWTHVLAGLSSWCLSRRHAQGMSGPHKYDLGLFVQRVRHVAAWCGHQLPLDLYREVLGWEIMSPACSCSAQSTLISLCSCKMELLQRDHWEHHNNRDGAFPLQRAAGPTASAGPWDWTSVTWLLKESFNHLGV